MFQIIDDDDFKNFTARFMHKFFYQEEEIHYDTRKINFRHKNRIAGLEIDIYVQGRGCRYFATQKNITKFFKEANCKRRIGEDIELEIESCVNYYRKSPTQKNFKSIEKKINDALSGELPQSEWPKSIADIMKSIDDPFAKHIYRKIMKFEEKKMFIVDSITEHSKITFVDLRNVYVMTWDEDDIYEIEEMYDDYMLSRKDRRTRRKYDKTGIFVEFSMPNTICKCSSCVRDRKFDKIKEKRRLYDYCREFTS